MMQSLIRNGENILDNKIISLTLVKRKAKCVVALKYYNLFENTIL